MKRPCPGCGKMVDDGLKCPPGISSKKLSKSHKYCHKCVPRLLAETEALIAKIKERKLK